MKLSAKKIEKKAKNIKIKSFNCVESTNKTARELAQNGAHEGTAVVALRQTAGKGRLGRSFLSLKGGVYLSIILRPQISPEDTLYITVAAAVAAADAIESISNKKCEIKWVNDIFINGKKICGILTEGEFQADGALGFAVLGVGINLFAPKGGFPDYLPLADSVFDRKAKIFSKKALKEQIIADFANKFFEFYQNLQDKRYIKAYQQRSLLTGKSITYQKDGKTFFATVSGIDDNARLLVKSGNQTIALSTGEVQITAAENLFEGKI